MDLDIIPKRYRIFGLQVDMPDSYEQIKKELDAIDWVNPNTINPLGQDLWSAQRSKCMMVPAQCPLLQKIQNFLHSDTTKQKIIETMYDNLEDLNWEYDFDPQRMYDHTRLHAELTRDRPGFVNVLHTDYRLLVATGMVYLTHHDDPDLSSQFYDDQHRSNPLRMPTEFGNGWWHANGNNTYHEGWNRTHEYRYSFLMGLTLNVMPVANQL
jgi:hypothetical protein